MPITHIKTPITNIVSGWLLDHANTMPDDVKDQFQCLVELEVEVVE